jgi:hypothetical protein
MKIFAQLCLNKQLTMAVIAKPGYVRLRAFSADHAVGDRGIEFATLTAGCRQK